MTLSIMTVGNLHLHLNHPGTHWVFFLSLCLIVDVTFCTVFYGNIEKRFRICQIDTLPKASISHVTTVVFC